MDSDDLMHPQRLPRQVEFIIAIRKLTSWTRATFTIDENNCPLGIRGDHH